MKKIFFFTGLFCLVFLSWLKAQHNAEFVNNAAQIGVDAGAIMTVWGDVHNLGGTLDNNGFIEVQGNLYSDNVFQQRGVGTVRIQNDDVNLGERQFIQGSYAVRGGQAAIGTNDGSFYNLELANTQGVVYLSGSGNVADVRNTVDFKPTTVGYNSLVTHDVGLTGAITYPANGASYAAVFGVMNPATGLTSMLNNTIDLNGNSSGGDYAYVIGRLRRAIAPAGGVYGYVMGLEPAGTAAARGVQYIHLDVQANTYDVIEGYFQQASLNTNTPNIECSGYQMDDFWGDRHGEWVFNDLNGISGGDYTVQLWPQDPAIAFSGIVWTISKDDVFLYPSPDPKHNDCGASPVGLDRGPFNGFSEFGVVSGNVNLPITLLSLEANPVDERYIQVNWATAEEENVSHFELERSLDGNNFNQIASEEASGNSNDTRYYSYNDFNVLPFQPYYYRIKAVDSDGSFEYTHIVNAQIKAAGVFNNMNVYPNPVSNELVIDLQFKSEGKATIKVYDAIGQEIYQQNHGVLQGMNVITVDAIDWVSGAYLIQVIGPNKFNELRRVIKMKR